MGGSDSKIEFKEKLNQFVTEKLSLDDDRFWNSLLHASLEIETIQGSLTLDAIRDLRQQQNSNLEFFFIRVLSELNSIIDGGDPDEKRGLSQESKRTIITCVRLLTRILPVLLEVPIVHPGDHRNTPNSYSTENHQVSPAVETHGMQGTTSGEVGGSDANGISMDHSSQSESEFVSRLFWQTPFRLNSSSAPTAPTEDQTQTEERSETPILAVQILTAVQRLLFLNGFTVSLPPGVTVPKHEVPPKHKVDSRFLWKGGVGATMEAATPTTQEQLKARTEVLRCLLACLSSTLYTTVDEYQSGSPPLWLWMFTRGYLPFTANLYCSLMSTVFTYDPYATYGLGLISPGSGEEDLVTVSLQVLCVLTDFNFSVHQTQAQPGDKQMVTTEKQSRTDNQCVKQGAPSSQNSQNRLSTDVRRSPNEETDTTPKRSNTTVVRNAYRLMLAGMKRDAEIDLIFDGIVRLLSTVSKSKSSYFGGVKMFPAYQELLIFFWHLLTINNHFCRRVACRSNVNDVVQPLLIVLLENSAGRRSESQAAPSIINDDVGKTADTDQQPSPIQKEIKSTASIPSTPYSSSDQERIGILHLCSFILLVLSSEREFAVGLNREYKEKFPLPIPLFRGCYADLLVIVTHKVILDSLGTVVNDSLIDMLLTVLCNVSAYVKTFCLESCVKLLNLLSRFSKPSWLFKASYHYHNVFFLLDVLNNAVQYQYEGNLCLVYAILRQKDLFLDLQNLSFPKSFESESSRNSESKSEATENNQSSPSVDSDELAARSISGNDSSPIVWKPTEKWFTDWKSRMPLHTLLRLISCLLPMVEKECQERGLLNQAEVLEYLKRTTMVGLLPVPHAIIIRSYFANAYTTLWFSTYTWSVIVARTQHLNLLDPKAIRFLSVSITDY